MAYIYRIQQKEDKDTRYAKAHKETMEKYGISWSWGRLGPGKYTGTAKLNTGKILTKSQLTLFIKRLIG